MRPEALVDALELIASQADNHKRSKAYNDGQNIALVNIRNIAMIALADQAREGSASAPSSPPVKTWMSGLLWIWKAVFGLFK